MTHQPVALITGATREIGAAMTETLVANGYAVLGSYNGDAAGADALATRLRAAGGTVAMRAANLADLAECRALVQATIETYGRIDALVANAGLTMSAPFLETTEEIWDEVNHINLKGSYFLAQAAARAMIAQGDGGRIVFSSSVTGLVACDGLSAYGITKAGINHMAVTLGQELGRSGITVNALGIGAVLNERNLRDDPQYEANWDRVTPTGRVGQGQDIAEALRFLLSPGARHITGHTLVTDGGWTNRSVIPDGQGGG